MPLQTEIADVSPVEVLDSPVGDRNIFSLQGKWSIVPSLVILLFASAACVWLVFASVRIENTLLNQYGFFFDPATYYLRNIEVFKAYQEHGAWATALQEITTNERCPARTVPYLLFAPKLLASTMGHLWTEVPLLFAFLTLLCSTVYERTRSLLFALASTSVFLALPFLYHPVLGLAAYWLDFSAACAMGCAALCMIRYLKSHQNGWMFAMGAFASLVPLCRWSAGSYLVCFLALAVPLLFAFRPLQNWKRITTALACALVTGLPGLTYMLAFFQSNISFYGKHGYALGAPVSQSIGWTAFALNSMVSTPVLALLLALTAAGLVVLVIRLKEFDQQQIRLTLLCTWFPVSVFVFVCFAVKAIDGYHPLVYFAPALFASAFCWLPELRTHRMWLHVCSCALVALTVFVAVDSYEGARKLAGHPRPDLKLQKETDAAVARFIVQTNSPSYAQFDNETVNPKLEVFFNHGRLCTWEPCFSVFESYMKLLAPGKSADEVATVACNKVTEKVPLVIVFAQPEQANAPGVFDNQYSATVSETVSRFVAHHPSWKFLGHINGRHGKLSVYQNTTLPKTAPQKL